MDNNKIYLSRKEASSYIISKGINVSISQLCKYVTFGGGPQYYKFGRKRVLYKKTDIDFWIQESLSTPLINSSQILRGCYD